MERSNRVRALAVLMAVGIVAMGVVLMSPNALAATRTWDTDADFNAGTLSSVEVIGTGAPATVQLIKDVTDWKNEAPPANPGAREGPAMVYDSTNGVVVLFGGYNGVNLADTWAYLVSANTWTNRVAAFTPARSGHGVAYHAGFDRLVLYGGAFLFSTYGDTWEYNYAANSWTMTVAGGSGPPARSSMGLSYRSVDSAAWLFGGNNGGPLGDTWRYFDFFGTRTWVSVPTSRSPPARDTFGITDMTSSQKSIVFGGVLTGGGRASDTWSLGPAYHSSGVWTSATADSGGANVNW